MHEYGIELCMENFQIAFSKTSFVNVRSHIDQRKITFQHLDNVWFPTNTTQRKAKIMLRKLTFFCLDYRARRGKILKKEKRREPKNVLQ